MMVLGSAISVVAAMRVVANSARLSVRSGVALDWEGYSLLQAARPSRARNRDSFLRSLRASWRRGISADVTVVAMPDSGLKADEVDQLRRWGAGLRNDPRPEVAAAGKAIELLIEEIERLHVLIWDRQLYPETADDYSPDNVSPYNALKLRLHGGQSRSASGFDPQREPSVEATFHKPSTDVPERGSF